MDDYSTLSRFCRTSGFALLPIVAVLGVALLGIAGYFAVITLSSTPPSLRQDSAEQATSTRALETSVSGTINPHDLESVLFTVGKTTSVRFTLDTPNVGMVMKVTDPKGASYTATAYTGNADTKEGERYTVQKKSDGSYHITITAPGVSTIGEYRVTVENPSTSISVPYTIDVHDAPIVVTSTQSTHIERNAAGVSIAITVGESVSIQGFVAISGAQVIANIVTPNGEKTSLALVEDLEHPGTYGGVYSGATESGSYLVEYVIQGENTAGEKFYKTTYDQFVVTSSTNTTSLQITKKFDINRSSEIQLIGY